MLCKAEVLRQWSEKDRLHLIKMVKQHCDPVGKTLSRIRQIVKEASDEQTSSAWVSLGDSPCVFGKVKGGEKNTSVEHFRRILYILLM